MSELKTETGYAVLDDESKVIFFTISSSRRVSIKKLVDAQRPAPSDELEFWLDKEDEGYRCIKVEIRPVEGEGQ